MARRPVDDAIDDAKRALDELIVEVHKLVDDTRRHDDRSEGPSG